MVLLDILEKKTRQILHMVFIKILLQQFKENLVALFHRQIVLYKVIILEYLLEVKLQVILLVLIYKVLFNLGIVQLVLQ